jgi:hypothetical protein
MLRTPRTMHALRTAGSIIDLSRSLDDAPALGTSQKLKFKALKTDSLIEVIEIAPQVQNKLSKSKRARSPLVATTSRKQRKTDTQHYNTVIVISDDGDEPVASGKRSHSVTASISSCTVSSLTDIQLDDEIHAS